MAKAAGTEEVAGVTGPIHDSSAALQEKTAVMPGYGFKTGASAESGTGSTVDAGTSAAGIVGAGLTLAIALAIGFALKLRASARANPGV